MEASSQQVLESYLDYCGCGGGKATPVHIRGLQDKGIFGGFLERENFIGVGGTPPPRLKRGIYSNCGLQDCRIAAGGPTAGKCGLKIDPYC